MPVWEQNDVRIPYQDTGSGFPVLLYAPGGMKSAISFWENTSKDGFDKLLTAAKDVESGGKSTVLRRNAELPISIKPSGGEEE